MKRRSFLQLTATGTGGLMLLPNFLNAQSLWTSDTGLETDNVVVFIQLNGGNDGLNTFIPYDNPLYYENRPTIGIGKSEIINAINGMGFHPALKDLATISQEGNLSIIQNVGYPEPNRSYFRSIEIWQTASDSHQYLDDGWLGRFLEIQCKTDKVAGLNVDRIDNLALKSSLMHTVTVKDFNTLRNYSVNDKEVTLSDNPQLDFVRKLQFASLEGMEEIQKALKKAPAQDVTYSQNELAKNLQWIGKLIKGNLPSKVYYTSLNGFDTHRNQTALHHKQLSLLNDAVYSFYNDLKKSRLLPKVTVVIFSEFGRRVKENGSGTDHGTAGPMIVIGGQNKGALIGKNPDLTHLDNGDLQYAIHFRSVYAALLRNKFNFDPTTIGIDNPPLSGLF